MKRNIQWFTGACVCVTLLAACAAKKTSPSVEVPVPQAKLNCSTANSYSNNIKGLVDMNCAKTCHSANRHADGIDLSTYELLKEEALKPRFLAAIKHQMIATPMPLKAAKLSDSTIQVIECWIVNGMAN